MKYNVTHRGEDIAVVVTGESPNYTVSIGDQKYCVNATQLGDESLLSMLLDNRSYLAHVVRTDERRGFYDVSIAGRHARLQVLDELSSMAQQMQAQQAGSGFVLSAPMPGLIVDVKVAVGDAVEPGSPLLVMEAMKMQNELSSEAAGRVTKISVEPGHAVEAGTELIVVTSD